MSLITKSTYLRGPKGDIGLQGPRGERGLPGAQGPQGVQGPNSNPQYIREQFAASGNITYNSNTGVISYTEPGRGINDLTDVDTITNPPTNGQVLAWNSAESIWKPNTISGSGGNSSGTPINISITTYDYDAIAGQTVFSGSDSNSMLLIMSPGNYIQVYKNGSLLRSEITWTYNIGVPGGDNITLSAPANAGDWIHIEVKDITNISEDLILDAGGYDSSGSVIDCGEYNGS